MLNFIFFGLVIAKLAKKKISDYIDKIKIKIKIVDKCEECEDYILIVQKKFYLISIMKILNISVFKTTSHSTIF